MTREQAIAKVMEIDARPATGIGNLAHPSAAHALAANAAGREVDVLVALELLTLDSAADQVVSAIARSEVRAGALNSDVTRNNKIFLGLDRAHEVVKCLRQAGFKIVRAE